MENPLQAIPSAAPHVEARADGRNCLQLHKPRQYSGGLGGRVARFLRAPADAQLQLDERGTFFWQQIDGEQSLETIAEVIRDRYAISPKESREAVIQFTKALMQRQFIQLKIPESTAVVRGSPDPAQEPNRRSPDPSAGNLQSTKRRGQGAESARRRRRLRQTGTERGWKAEQD